MPELPEVETIRLGLTEKIIGKKIKDVEVNVIKIFQGSASRRIIGAKFKKIRRRGKILILDLDNGNSLIIHLKLTGQLVYHPSTSLRLRGSDSRSSGQVTFGHPIPFAGTTLPAKTTHVIFTFNDGSKLYYNDVRKFGWIRIVQSSKLKDQSFLKDLGPEPLTKEFTQSKFKNIVQNRKKPIKLILMDQTEIAGVGNIYANEALFLAKIDPGRKANALKKEEIELLYDSLLEVLKEGIKYGGSSENAYVNAMGQKGEMQNHFRVYSRAGEKCPRCGGKVKRITLGGRGTFYCPACQK